ncbi:MAG: ATP-binding protein, partial [Paraclostridium dentum]
MLDFYYVLARINMVIFIVLFFMLMNKRGYAYNIKTNIRFILILILLIALIKDGMPLGVVVLQILIVIISILSLICKITYKIDMKESIINSLMYSLFYILIECSIYWILQCSLKYEAIHMIILDIAINFIIIFTGIYFFDRLQKIYNDKKYYICIILTIPVNVVIILFLNISDEKIGDLYSIVVKNNIEYTHLLDTIVISGFMQSTFPYILFLINIILISIFIN